MKLETNLDDCSSEALGFASGVLFEAGALDVFFSPIYMKKSRPAYLLTVLCRIQDQGRMEEIIFRHTTSIGIRCQLMQRTKLARKILSVPTPWGAVKIKYCSYDEAVYCYPEHESIARICREYSLSYTEVSQQVKSIGTAFIQEIGNDVSQI